MQTDTFLRALHTFADKRPFGLFDIELVNGHRLLVGHPEAVRADGELFWFTDPFPATHEFFDASSVARVMALAGVVDDPLSDPDPADEPF